MEQKNSNQNSRPTVRYPLASAARRIGAKILDIILISIIVLLLGLAVFATDPSFQWKQPYSLSQPWRYGLFVTLMMIVFGVWMFLIPNFTKWTIGMKACNLSYVNILPLTKFSWNLFKHELLVWELICLLSFVIGWVLSFLQPNQIQSIFDGITYLAKQALPEGADKVCYYVGVTFGCLYTGLFLVLIALVVAICVKNKKPAIHDKFSNIYVVCKKPINDPNKLNNVKKQKSRRINYGVPGEINSGSFEELDNLE